MPRKTFGESLWSRVDYIPGGCWLWTGPLSRHGYPTRIKNDGRWFKPMRLSYALLIGHLPDDVILDHMCHLPGECLKGVKCEHRKCVNPAHLKPSTGRANTLRGDGPAAVNSRKTHCIRGHPLSGDNLLNVKSGRRVCRTCHNEQCRINGARYRARRKR